jgi:hypothetical protein
VNTRAVRPGRVFALLALTAPMVGGVLATAPSPAFAASGSINAPSSGAVYTDGTTSVPADATGTFNSGETVKLATTDGPAGTDLSQNATLTNCTTSLTRNCSGRSFHLSYNVGVNPSRPNGSITLTLSGSGLSSTRTFYTNFKPTGTPGNVAAAANGRTGVDLSWSYSGSEPDGDKAGFEVTQTHNGTSSTFSVATSACSGSSCSYAVTGLPQPDYDATETYSYTVTALRKSGGCDACGDYTRSAASSSASADLVGPPPPPSPTPTPTPSDGGTTGSTTAGGTTGSTTDGTTGSTTGSTTGATAGGSTGATTGTHSGGTTGTHSAGSTGSTAKPIVVPTLPPLVASRRSFALGFNKFSPSLGIPKLPPLPATTFPVTAPGSDTYQPTLPYKTEPKKTTSVLSSPIAAISGSIGLDTEQLMKLIALGLVLLASASHVRLFLSHSTEE